MAKIRVVLADDHHAVLSEVRQILAEEFDVVAAVEDGERAVDAILKLNPDALVIDISMPILNGLQAAKQLQTASCRAKIIFLSVYDGLEFVEAAFSAGAYGYVTKSTVSADLVPAIHEAMLGHTFVSAPLPA
jgi:DNA-binding NarL/FixJ family response regulator